MRFDFYLTTARGDRAIWRRHVYMLVDLAGARIPERALREAGDTRQRNRWIFSGRSLTFKCGVRAASRLMKEQTKLPDAIFAFSDSTAIGAMKELNNHGVEVPRDISVVGFDNTAVSEMFIPSITTVAQPQYTMGFTAMDLLIQKINRDSGCDPSQILSHEIIIRDSVE
ncbi:MAG: substrate-binding domain-containing protein [Clostridia bacterium]